MELPLTIQSGGDIVVARQQGRSLALRLGFSDVDQIVIATAISEVARNIVEYAQQGAISISPLHQGGRTGILIVAEDQGPGIADLGLAMQVGYSTGRGLGLGLPGARRLMDEFEIASVIGRGTTVTMKKWVS
ncbi:MAG TPA: anti-sigma regulatory factor [bacterium]|nr:anti-sigma regulatory factor [bacterium]